MNQSRPSSPPSLRLPPHLVTVPVTSCPITGLATEALHARTQSRGPVAIATTAALNQGVRCVVRGRLVGEGCPKRTHSYITTRPLPAFLALTLRKYITCTPSVAILVTRCQAGWKKKEGEHQKEHIGLHIRVFVPTEREGYVVWGGISRKLNVNRTILRDIEGRGVMITTNVAEGMKRWQCW